MSKVKKNLPNDTLNDKPVEAAEDMAVAAVAEVEPPAKSKGSKKTKAPKASRIPYERRKALYGYGFIGIWILGTIYFFIMPLFESLIWSFNETAVRSGEMELRTPLILIFSIFIAVILNQKFRGRTFARAVFFLPVIIATGPVIDIINGNMSTGGYAGGSEQFSTMFEADLVDQLLNFLGVYNISDTLTETINSLTTDIFNLVWNSGIQILLFLSALQGIPFSAKEAAQMEGATGWEYFWKITIPYISPMILASLVYTVVDSFVDPSNEVMTIILNQGANWEHGYMSAMAWAYFLIVGIVLAIIVAIINRFVYYEVE